MSLECGLAKVLHGELVDITVNVMRNIKVPSDEPVLESIMKHYAELGEKRQLTKRITHGRYSDIEYVPVNDDELPVRYQEYCFTRCSR